MRLRTKVSLYGPQPHSLQQDRILHCWTIKLNLLAQPVFFTLLCSTKFWRLHLLYKWAPTNPFFFVVATLKNYKHQNTPSFSLPYKVKFKGPKSDLSPLPIYQAYWIGQKLNIGNNPSKNNEKQKQTQIYSFSLYLKKWSKNYYLNSLHFEVQFKMMEDRRWYQLTGIHHEKDLS